MYYVPVGCNAGRLIYIKPVRCVLRGAGGGASEECVEGTGGGASEECVEGGLVVGFRHNIGVGGNYSLHTFQIGVAEDTGQPLPPPPPPPPHTHTHLFLCLRMDAMKFE